ncbi:MAG: hypothetical protein AB1467_06030 [Candidatus Diapherotrites archaeon]
MPHRPRHYERVQTQEETSQGMPSAPGVSYALPDIARDVRALNSSILLLSQKMNYLVRNEKILGRNLIILNKKIKELEQRISFSVSGASALISGEPSASPAVSGSELAELEERVNSLSSSVSELKDQMEKMKGSFARADELKELKYVIDAINPLEFATLQQVKDLVAGKSVSPEKPKKYKKKKK